LFIVYLEEEFQTRLSQVIYEVSSCADGTQEQSSADPTQDDSIRTRCWIETVRGKKKGRLYGVGQLVSKYTGPNESLNQLPASFSSNTEDLTNIRQQLSRSLEENEQLRSKFQSFQSLVLQYLPPNAQARLQQPQPQPQPQPQQPNPTQQNSEIPPPHSQQQNNEEDDNLNEESSPNYEDY